MITPIDYYLEKYTQGLIEKDPLQWDALQDFQALYFELIKKNEHCKRSN